MVNYLSNLPLFRLLLKYKFHLLVVMVVSAGVSAVLSGEAFIRPRYKSFAVVYPSNLIPYSSETPTEQMLQLMQSGNIRDSIIKKYDLAGHYGIEKNSKAFNYLINLEYEQNIKINKTEYESVEIEVLDTDPKIAAAIVSDIISLMNLKARNLQREKSREVVTILKEQMFRKKSELDSLTAAMHSMSVRYGILDYDIQVKEAYRGYFKGASNNSKASLHEADAVLRVLEEKGSEAKKLKEMLNACYYQYAEVKFEYDKAIKDITKELTYANVITKPVPADKKAYPVRWIIVLMSTASAMFLAVITLVLTDGRKKAKLRQSSLAGEN